MGVLICKQKLIDTNQIELCKKSVDEITDITKVSLDDFYKDNTSIKTLFKKFDSAKFTYTFEEYDYKQTFKELGLNYDDYEYFKSDDTFDVDNDEYIFKYIFLLKDRKSDDDNRRVVIDTDNIKTVFNDYDTLIFNDIESFKGMYLESFWKYTLVDEFTDDKIDDNSIVVITSNDDLDQLKLHFKPDAPIQNWSLNDNEIVYVSW